MVVFLLAALYWLVPAALAVITAFPTPTQVMTPLFLFTLATFVLEDPKVTSVFAPVTFCVSLEPTFLFSFLFFESYLSLRLCATFGWGCGRYCDRRMRGRGPCQRRGDRRCSLPARGWGGGNRWGFACAWGGGDCGDWGSCSRGAA